MILVILTLSFGYVSEALELVENAALHFENMMKRDVSVFICLYYFFLIIHYTLNLSLLYLF